MTPQIVLTTRPCTGQIFLPYGELYRNQDGTIWRPWFAKDGVHRGDDYTAYQLPIYAAHPGICVVANDGDGWGLYVKIKHPDGWETISAHLSKVLVKGGQKVNAGDQIGISGNSGSAKDYPHFHHELRACFLKLPDTGPRCQQAPSQFYAAIDPVIPPVWEPPTDITPPPEFQPPLPDNGIRPGGGKYTVLAQGLRVRNGPGTNYLEIGNLPVGAKLIAQRYFVGEQWVEFEPGKWCATNHAGMELCSKDDN